MRVIIDIKPNNKMSVDLIDGLGEWRKRPVVVKAGQLAEEYDISTLEGVMHGNVGDWLIIGVNGEVYPCKPDIFTKTYERVKDD